jgi:hypothetical protein
MTAVLSFKLKCFKFEYCEKTSEKYFGNTNCLKLNSFSFSLAEFSRGPDWESPAGPRVMYDWSKPKPEPLRESFMHVVSFQKAWSWNSDYDET